MLVAKVVIWVQRDSSLLLAWDDLVSCAMRIVKSGKVEVEKAR